METLTFIKDYRDHAELRGSFNLLATNTFGIEFEDWYQNGYWMSKYIPYSFVTDKNIVVANVSVNLVNLIIQGEEVSSIQIGTVMTDKEYRNKGLARLLMEKVIEDFRQIPFMYLFANESVLNFYPRFGFRPLKETLFSCSYAFSGNNSNRKVQLNGSKREDLNFIYNMALQRTPVSKVFSTKDTAELVMFYSMKVFPNDCYWIEGEKSVVFCQHEGSTLHIYDIINHGEVQIANIIGALATEKTNKITFHFTPRHLDKSFILEEFMDTTSLLVRTIREFNIPKYFKHPITSQA